MSRRGKTQKRFRKSLMRTTAILVLGTFLSGQLIFAKDNPGSGEPISEDNGIAGDLETAEQLGNLIAEQWEEDYFAEMIVETGSRQIEVDGENCDIQEEFSLSAGEARQIVASETSIEEYFETEADGYYETERIGSGKVQVTAPFQTRRLIVTDVELKSTFDASETVDFSKYHTTILQYDTEEQTREAYDKITEMYGEEACQPDRVYSREQLFGETTGTGDYECISWGSAMMGMEKLKNQEACYLEGQEPYPITNTVTVAVIDTGINKNNYVFDGHTITDSSRNFQVSSENDQKVYENTDISDDATATNGHGTHVAGIIADATPDNVELMVLKVFDSNGNAAYASIYAAMVYAVERGADVINMSLGFDGVEETNREAFASMDNVINYAYAKKIPICAAAGNENSNVSTCYPACNEKVFSVGAIDSNGNRWVQSNKSASNYGETLDFCAPGVKIYSAAYNSDDGLVSKTGTSMASPHLAAAVSCVKLLYPDASVKKIEEILKSYCVDLGEEDWDEYYGWGYPDLSGLYGSGDTKVMDFEEENPEEKIPSAGEEQTKTESVLPPATVPDSISSQTEIQKPSKVKSFKIKQKTSGSVKLQWKKNKEASGYQIQYSLKKNFKTKKTILIKKSGKTSYLLKKLKKGRNYYFRIRAFQTVNGGKLYSVWSARKKVKIK